MKHGSSERAPLVRRPRSGAAVANVRVCVVTGAASGIGKATAVRFIQEGFRIVAVDRSQEGLHHLRKSLSRSRIHPFVCDLSDVASVTPVARGIVTQFGAPRVLVNNAGICLYADITKTTDELWLRSLNVNLVSAAAFVRELVPFMEGVRGAAIVNVSSRNALSSSPHTSTYDAAKGALLALTRTLAVELGSAGIRVNAVLPGFIDTPIHKDLLKDRMFANNYRKLIPLNRFGTPTDIANVIYFLASDQADFITGQGIVADGGQMSGQNYARIFGNASAFVARQAKSRQTGGNCDGKSS